MMLFVICIDVVMIVVCVKIIVCIYLFGMCLFLVCVQVWVLQLLVFIIVEVYEWLVVEGFIVVWFGLGFYVIGLVVLLVLVEMGLLCDCQVDLLWLVW